MFPTEALARLQTPFSVAKLSLSFADENLG